MADPVTTSKTFTPEKLRIAFYQKERWGAKYFVF
jgi:hypothetical protein